MKGSVSRISLGRQKRVLVQSVQRGFRHQRYDVHRHLHLSRASGGRGAFHSSLRFHLVLTGKGLGRGRGGVGGGGGDRPSSQHRGELISHCFSPPFLITAAGQAPDTEAGQNRCLLPMLSIQLFGPRRQLSLYTPLSYRKISGRLRASLSGTFTDSDSARLRY